MSWTRSMRSHLQPLLARSLPRAGTGARAALPAVSVARAVPVRALSVSAPALKKKDNKKDKGGKKAGKKAAEPEDDEDDELPARGKKGKPSAATGEGEFDPDVVEKKLGYVQTRAKTVVADLLSRIGRPDPKVLEKLLVQLHHNDKASSHGLTELATVGVQNNQFVIHCFDPEDVKAVEKAVYDSPLDLVPIVQPGDEEGTIRIPVPKPTVELRDLLAKELGKAAEHARREARDVRRIAMKGIKNDIDEGVTGESLGKKLEKDVDKEIKKVTDVIDKLQTDGQKKLKAVVVDDA